MNVPLGWRRRSGGGGWSPRDIVCSGTFDEINRFFAEREWTDGLPVVPPTLD